ncbi:MAG: hypothetical protein ACK41E_08190 [Deinococcales bacterium]
MKRLIGLTLAGLLAVVGCQQQPTPQSKSRIVGTLELELGGSGQGRALLRPLASTPVPDSAITVGPINSTYGSDANFRYVRAQVNLTANQAFGNLTLYAYNKSGNLGGTALKNLLNFTGGNTAADAQSLLPIHARNASGAYITGTEDFQAFSSAEAGALQSTARGANVIGAGETILQYGFVARKTATTRALANGDTGVVNIAYKIPIGAQADNTYKFTATFVVADETVARVTRDIDESTAQADARAGALTPPAAEVALLGTDSDTSAVASTVRINTIPIGTEAEVYIQNFDSIGSGLPTDWEVRTGATATTLGTVVAFNTAQVNWANTAGAFKNFASASCSPEIGCTDRALGVRQTGGFGDPGASFVYTLANTTRYIGYKVELEAQMLSVQPRSTTWTLDYQVGSGAFTTLTTYTDPSTFGSTPISVSLGNDADNQSASVRLRISALNISTGSGSRDSFGIDNFKLRATPVIP